LQIQERRFKNPATDALGLNAAEQARLQNEIQNLARVDQQSPVLNGALSAILPGLGQARLGLWQDAALTFALNFVSIGATVELARKDLTMPAVAAGTFASLFYVGGITSSWRLTKERNERRRRPGMEKIQDILFPELRWEF
jgi:hypothetical protein